MAAFLFITLLVVVAVGWLTLRDRIQGLEFRLRWLAKEDRSALERQIAELTGRVRRLEQQTETVPLSPAQTEPAAARAPVPQLVTKPVRIAQEPEPVPYESPTAFTAAPGFVAAPPRARRSDKLRRLLADSEWEALVAGSLLNKLGALILVIGIALFLGYSFRLVTPAGRGATAAVVSISILAAGVILERRQQYRVFSRGLIGAGSAALYTTAYALYALPAAQVITNPFAGSILVLAVAAGMIAHSLRYRAQAVTAVAYFSAFAALAVTPSTPFAVGGLIPLSASLLYFAWRFEWHAMALFGLFATYATCISRGEANASLYATTSLLLTYWLLFESFDILRSRRGVQSAGLTWIFPLNAIAFLALTYRTWALHASQPMWQIAGISAFLFFASAMARLGVASSPTGTAPRDPLNCIRRGSYEAPITLAGILAGLAILGRVTGFWTNVALAFEAEIFYLAGVRFRSRFLCGLGRSGFFASLSDVLWTFTRHTGMVTVLGIALYNWTPSVIVHTWLFYLNRAVKRTAVEFSFAATGLAALVITCELAPRIAPLALFLFALIILEFGLRKQWIDFRIQSYLLALAAVFSALSAADFAPHPPAFVSSFSAACAFACWLLTGRVLFVRAGEPVAKEMAVVRDLFAACGSMFALFTLWMLLPGAEAAAAWTGFALVWLAVASRLNLPSFRWLGAGILGLGYARLLNVNLGTAWETQNAFEQWLIPLLVIAALYWTWHTFRRVSDHWQRSFAPIFTWLAALAAVWLLQLGVNHFYLASAWGLLGLVLLTAGLRMQIGAFRWQSYCIQSLAVVSCVVVNFAQSSRMGMFARISGASLLIGCLFAAEFLLPRKPDRLGAQERHARTLASLAAMLLLTALLYHEVSGGFLTVAWGLEALVCLAAGFPARERILRLQGLVVFALCILKLFVYDLRSLEAMYRILSFIALGAILLGVSLVYTRFRNQIQRYL